MIVAAGNSNRLGQPKQLLIHNGQSLIENVIQNALTVSSNCSVVLGANYRAVHNKIIDLPIEIYLHKQWQFGIGSSIAFGLKNQIEKLPQLEYLMILLCDQPFVSTDLLSEMKSLHLKSTSDITASRYDDDLFGVPAIFSKKYFPELLKLNEDKGAKKIISNNLHNTYLIDFPKGNIDIDTTEDLHYLE